MKNILKYLFEQNFDFCLENSYKNCHVMGMHSIVLQNINGNLIRLFYCDGNHQLYKNKLSNFLFERLSLGYHDHASNLKFEILFGEVTNNLLIETDNINNVKDRTVEICKYKFDSKINGGTGGFTDKTLTNVTFMSEIRYNKGESFEMKSEEIHNIYVPVRTHACWLILENTPTKKQETKWTFSNYDLTELKPDKNMYVKFKKDELKNIFDGILSFI